MTIDATERVLKLPLFQARRSLAHERAASPASSTYTDEELLGRIGHRDEEALLTLFRRYSRLIFSIGCRILRDEGEAEDLVQDIFLNLYGVETSFDREKGAARTWMVQIIYRRAFDRRAYLTRRHFYRGTDVQEYANALTGEKTIEEDVIERVTVQQLRAAFDDLTGRQRETLEMFFFEGLKLAEIAERLGEDVPNVRHHYYRGLERLRQVAREMMRNGKGDQ